MMKIFKPKKRKKYATEHGCILRLRNRKIIKINSTLLQILDNKNKVYLPFISHKRRKIILQKRMYYNF